MEINECYTIDELYEQLKDFDLIFTTEAHLADSLNNRLDKPFLGKFSDTPKRYVLNEIQDKILDERQLFINLITNLDITWKQASYFLMNIVECWKETGELKKILEIERFNNQIVKDIIGFLENTNNIFKAMDEYSFQKKISVAVVNLYQFNELDKKVLPKDCTEIITFKKDKIIQLPKFKIFNSGTEIIQTLINNIKKVNPNDIAIVLEPKSRYQSLIESALKSNDIPYLIGKKLAEGEDLRAFLSLIRVAINEENVRLKEIQPLLHSMDIHISIKHNEKFITKINVEDKDLEKFLRFLTFLKEIKGSTISQVLEKYEKLIKRELTPIKENFEELNILKEDIKEETINQLEFYLDSFDIAVDPPVSGGVLFVSPKSVSYVDRPIIFHIGMDATWTPNIPNNPWINKEKVEERNLNNFKILLQNGERQYYLVQHKLLNEHITPSFYFNEILDKKINSFLDLPHEFYNAPSFEEETKGFQKEQCEVEIEEIKVISQSQLNKFLACPRDYLFSRFIRTPDNFYLKRGYLYHQFAEFYRDYSDFVKTQGVDQFIDLMVKELERFKHKIYHNQLKTEVKIGVKLIMKYIDMGIRDGEIQDVKLNGYEKKPKDNIFAKKFGKTIETTTSEMWFENLELGVKGIVDLIQSDKHLLDFKSGMNMPSLNNMMKKSNIEFLDDEPNFQALLYLTHLRQKIPNKPLKFTFYYFLNKFREVLKYTDEDIETLNIERNKLTIKYFPGNFGEVIIRRETFEYLLSNNDTRKVLDIDVNEKAIGYEKYVEFFQDNEFPCELKRDEIVNSPLADKFETYVTEIFEKSYKYIEKGCSDILKKLVDYRNRIFLKEDVDKFEEKIKEWINEINSYKNSKFPIGDRDIDKIKIDRSLIYFGRD